MSPKIIVMDEEISKTIYATYPSNKPQYLRHTDIIQDWFMICVAWKQLGHNKRYSVSLLDDPKRFKEDFTDDYHVVKTLHGVLKECDAIIGHNMERFDWPKFLERSIYHHLPPIEKPKIIDTLRMAKKVGFSYRSLDYVSGRLSVSRKKSHSGNAMWMSIVKGDGDCEKYIKECVLYCKDDLPPCEELYNRLAPHLPQHMDLNRALFKVVEGDYCTHCGSTNLSGDGWYTTPKTRKRKYVCKDCGRYCRSQVVLKRTK